MRPTSAKNPPRLLATGTVNDNSLSIQCYLDTEPIFTVEEPIRAILMLLATYYVFGIKWPTATRLPLVFLVCCTAGPVNVSYEVGRNNKLKDLLKRVKVL